MCVNVFGCEYIRFPVSKGFMLGALCPLCRCLVHAAFLPLFKELVQPTFEPLLNEGVPQLLHWNALCVFVDLIEVRITHVVSPFC